MMLRKCPLCGREVKFEDGYIVCDCGLKYDVAIAGNKIDAAMQWNQRVKLDSSLEEQLYDWLDNIIVNNNNEDGAYASVIKRFLMTRFTPSEVCDIMVENGQADTKRFKVGETIKYSPAEVKELLEKERK